MNRDGGSPSPSSPFLRRPRSVEEGAVVFRVLALEVVASPLVGLAPERIVEPPHLLVPLLVERPDEVVQGQHERSEVFHVVLPLGERPVVGVAHGLLAEAVGDLEVLHESFVVEHFHFRSGFGVWGLGFASWGLIPYAL